MARLARVVAVGEPHHLAQRGNNRQPTFFDDQDRDTYCRLLAGQCVRAGVRLLGYCLMPNHVHVVAIPDRPDSFARGMGRAHYVYARAVHERWGGSGHLWAKPLFLVPAGPRSSLDGAAVCGPQSCAGASGPGCDRVRLVERAGACGREGSLGLVGHRSVGGKCVRGRTGRRCWEAAETKKRRRWAALRQATASGRPLGGDAFVERLERTLRRKLNPKRTGRPKKAAAAGP